ncbi:MAG: hypothetical protein AUI47_03065 [Acidobacteria bacterium 13_1_40CM_2_68_5]|nr:MAG: hypothetical protein AUI47_03065 [Acidobacteria bacterium 13_1_40CM_2_68_5]
MKRLLLTILLVTVTWVLAQTQPTSTTIQGYVIDSACLFIKNLGKPVSKECALKCAKAGSPLVILADNGTFYLPISSEMPATGQNERLMKFAGDRVIIRGKVFERGGAHAVVIEEINAEPAAR